MGKSATLPNTLCRRSASIVLGFARSAQPTLLRGSKGEKRPWPYSPPIAARLARAHSVSCSSVPPLAPTPPSNCPFIISGNPPPASSNGDRPVTAPAFAPSVGRLFNIGVSERNRHNLRFTVPLGNGQFAPVVLPLANEDGSTTNHIVTFDIDLAATTGRAVDIGRFKVPQLRTLVRNAPYFHDNSANTIEEVVDHFLSDWYKHSSDGRNYPIRLNAQQRHDLIEFLKIL